MNPKTLPSRILQFGLTRIVLAVLAIAATAFLVQLVVGSVLDWLGLGPRGQFTLWFVIPLVIAVHFVYIGFVHLVERRPAAELSGRGAVRETGAGIAVGAGLQAACVAAVTALGLFQVTGLNPVSVVVPTLAMSVASGYVEEVVFRGVLFRIVEESLGTWIALALTSLLFGFAHISNPNATAFSTFAIAMEAGVLLGAAYVLTRRLWLAVGIHFAWNFTQGGIFGGRVSGLSMDGLLESELSGPMLLSGGEFGLEASVFALTLGTATGVLFLVRAGRRGQFIAPFWRRPRHATPQGRSAEPRRDGRAPDEESACEAGDRVGDGPGDQNHPDQEPPRR